MPEDKKLFIKEASEPYRATLEAIKQLLPLANVKDKEGFDIIHRFNMLCEHYDVNQATELLHLMFRRKR